MRYFAHTGPSGGVEPDGQPLTDHLRGVAEGAAARVAAAAPGDLGLEDATRAAGLLHDVGKYRPEFQQYLRGLRAGGPRTHHKQAGAVPALDGGNEYLAAAILGHHGGLPDLAEVDDGVEDPDRGRPVYEACRAEAEWDTPELVGLDVPPSADDLLAADLYARLVFSCLVDADWTDTRRHEQTARGEPAEPTPPPMDADTWLGRVLATIEGRAAGVRAKNPALARTRDDILQACLKGAERPPGLFTLTVPTGGGKTLSGLAFTLKHISRHNPPDGRPRIRRVIYVAPYLSILEQNADAIRDAIGFDLRV
jgi:CRISPR-associated endonuclease/helicase Cas3